MIENRVCCLYNAHEKTGEYNDIWWNKKSHSKESYFLYSKLNVEFEALILLTKSEVMLVGLFLYIFKNLII